MCLDWAVSFQDPNKLQRLIHFAAKLHVSENINIEQASHIYIHMYWSMFFSQLFCFIWLFLFCSHIKTAYTAYTYIQYMLHFSGVFHLYNDYMIDYVYPTVFNTENRKKPIKASTTYTVTTLKYQFAYLNVVAVCLIELDSVCLNGWAGQGKPSRR